MSLFIVFLLGAVLLGAGVMLSPVWRTAQPRVALSAAFCLALVVGGAVFYAEIFGWSALAVDYLLFALLSGVVLGGTLSTAQARAEAKGERLADSEQGWPGPQDLAFFAIAALVILLPLFHLPAAPGAQAQILGLHSLTARLGESFRSLAPLYPEAPVMIAPGFHALSAYLSQQLDQPIPLTQLSAAAALFYLLVWLTYDFGAEWQDKRLGRAMAIAVLLCGGLYLSCLDGHFSELMGLLFMQACLLYALRCLRRFSLADMVAGGLMMGAVIYASLTASIILLFGFVSLCLLAWQSPRVRRKPRLGLTFGFPLVALLGTAPWLVNSWDSLPPPSPSPFSADIALLGDIILGQGILIVPLAILGAWVGLRQSGDRRLVTGAMIGWLLLVLDFALLGLLGRLLPPLAELVNAPNLARHGVILPFGWLGGLALLHLWESRLSSRWRGRLRKAAYPLMMTAALLALLLGLAFQPIMNVLRPLMRSPQNLINGDDIAAMIWLREHTAADAIVSAADGDAWLPIYAERQALDFRAARYFEWDEVELPDRGQTFDYLFERTEAAAHPGLKLVYQQGTARVYQSVSSPP